MQPRLVELLDNLTQLDDAVPVPARQVRRVEYQLATMIAEHCAETSWNSDAAIEHLVDSCADDLPLAAILLGKDYACMTTQFHRLRAWLRIRLRGGQEQQSKRAEQVIATYQVDAKFLEQVQQAVRDLDHVYQNDKSGQLSWMRTCLSMQSSSLFARSVFAGLGAVWNQDESSEPLLWRLGELLESLAKEGSFHAVTEGLRRLTAFGLLKLAEGEQADTLRGFLVKANEDTSGNLLDNLVVADRTYRDLTAEGWKPDRWEMENMAMTISLYLRFMVQMEIRQDGQVGRRLEITLDQAQQAYRYSGSPFLSADDQKEVEIQAPGWRYRGELVVRPKVREVVE